MRVSLPQLAPGAILAEPVTGPGGRQLAAAGTAITEQHLKVLRIWGIDAVEIRTAAAAPTPAEDAALVELQRAIALRFRGQPADHPTIRTLFQFAVATRQRGPR